MNKLRKHIMHDHEGVPRKPETPIIGPDRKCVCGIVCHGYARLRNHLVHEHHAELAYKYRSILRIKDNGVN